MEILGAPDGQGQSLFKSLRFSQVGCVNLFAPHMEMRGNSENMCNLIYLVHQESTR